MKVPDINVNLTKKENGFRNTSEDGKEYGRLYLFVHNCTHCSGSRGVLHDLPFLPQNSLQNADNGNGY